MPPIILLIVSASSFVWHWQQVQGAWLAPAASRPGLLLIKVAVFVDASLGEHLAQDIGLSEDQQIRGLVEAYVHQLEALMAGLRSEQVEGVRVRLVDTFLNHFNSTNGNLDELLSDFCLYQMELNKQRRRRRRTSSRWDLGLLLTSRDLYSEQEVLGEGEAKSRSTTGISPVGGINWPDLSCLVVELGVGYHLAELEDSPEQRVYPTRGLAGSALVAAHELAHSLGVHHDDTDDYIMSATQAARPDQMHLNWSPDSSARLDQLASSLLARFRADDDSMSLHAAPVLPGQLFDAQFQCRMFSKNLQPISGNNEAICNKSLLCNTIATTHNQLVAIGPALEGTKCGPYGGLCLRRTCSPLAPKGAAAAAVKVSLTSDDL